MVPFATIVLLPTKVGTDGQHKGQYLSNKEKRGGGGHGRAAIPVPQTGFKGPIPTSTSSPAPTILGLSGPIRRRVVARPVFILYLSLNLKCIGQRAATTFRLITERIEV